MFNLKMLFDLAKESAKKNSHEYYSCDHLMLALCDAEDSTQKIKNILEDSGVKFSSFHKELKNVIQCKPSNYGTLVNGEPQMTSTLINFKDDVHKVAILSQLPDGPGLMLEHILYELLIQPNTVFSNILDSMIDIDEIISHIESSVAQSEMGMGYDEAEGNSGDTAIERYCLNLNELAKSGKFNKLIGRETEISDITQILARRNKNNCVIVGEPGVGKTQIVEGLANAIVQGNVPKTLANRVIISLNVGSMLAGAKFRGDFEKRLQDLLKELKPEHILFIDEIHTIMGTGANSESTLDMANMLKPYLSSGNICVVGATTFSEYRRTFEKDAALTRRFMKLTVQEPTIDETKKILRGVKKVYETYHGVKYSNTALDAIIRLSERYIHNKQFPDKAIDLMDAAGARNAVSMNPKATLEDADIAFEVSCIANIPLCTIVSSNTDTVRTLKSSLSKKVFGQDSAVEKLVESFTIARAGLRGKNTTQGNYLFVGPSGVGKTEIAKVLSESIGTKLIRFDMSEFMEKHTISKLIGSPPGYVGYSDGNGKLVDAIENHPDCILLLDEVEKAHPDVFNLFLQILDEGQLQSSAGKIVKFHNTTIIMTTNLGSKNSQQLPIGNRSKPTSDGIDSAIKGFFRPEFLNRLDSIVRFNELDDGILASVAKKFIDELNQEIKHKSARVKLTKQAYEWLVQKGKTPGMGARPIKRLISDNVKKPLANEMLFGALQTGGTALFDIQDGELKLIQLPISVETLSGISGASNITTDIEI